MFLSKSVFLVPELVGTELLWEEWSRSQNFFPGAGAEETLFGSAKLKKIFLLKSDSIIGKFIIPEGLDGLVLKEPWRPANPWPANPRRPASPQRPANPRRSTNPRSWTA